MTWADDLAKLKAIEDLPKPSGTLVGGCNYSNEVLKILRGEIEPLPAPPEKVRLLHNATTLNVPPDRILRAAMGNVDEVVLVGWDKDDNLYAASSMANGGDILWLMEKAKQRLFRAVGGEGVF